MKRMVAVLLGILATLSIGSRGARASDGNREATAVLAGGCFWGVDAVFKHVKGVDRVVAGYAGGDATTANYAAVSTGSTGHAESVAITYDPRRVSYHDLLQVFFFVAHDPTELNRQGPDTGTQYRSAIFFEDATQQRIAENYLAELDRKKAFPAPLVTQLVPLRVFYPAEDYHQDYLARHPYNLYILLNDRPKLGQLREKFPQLYRQ